MSPVLNLPLALPMPVTVCVVVSLLVTVTLLPAFTVSFDGLNLKLLMMMVFLAAADVALDPGAEAAADVFVELLSLPEQPVRTSAPGAHTVTTSRDRRGR